MSVKPKVQWRPQKVGEIRNVGHLRKTATREKLCELQLPAVPQGQSRPSSLEFTSRHRWLRMLHMGLEDFMFVLLDSGLAFVPFPSIPLFVPFGMEMSVLCHWMLEVCKFFFRLYRVLQLKVCLKFQRKLWTWTFQRCWNRTLATLGDGLNTFCTKGCVWVFGRPGVECYSLGLDVPQNLMQS